MALGGWSGGVGTSSIGYIGCTVREEPWPPR